MCGRFMRVGGIYSMSKVNECVRIVRWLSKPFHPGSQLDSPRESILAQCQHHHAWQQGEDLSSFPVGAHRTQAQW